MSTVTIAAHNIPNWQYGGLTAELRIFPNQTFLPLGGTSVILQGSKNAWYQKITCNVNASVLIIPEILLDATTDSSNPRGTYTAVLFDSKNVQRDMFPNTAFRLFPAPSNTTWEEIFIYNQAAYIPGNPTYLSAEQTLALLSQMTLGEGGLLSGGDFTFN